MDDHGDRLINCSSRRKSLLARRGGGKYAISTCVSFASHFQAQASNIAMHDLQEAGPN